MAGEIGVDPRTMEWTSRRPGIFNKRLHENPATGEYTTLMKLDPGSRFPKHSHPSGEELFVIEGRIRIEGKDYDTGCYVYSPPGAIHDVVTETGALLLIRMPGPAKILED
jgi:quercetin dioxygenase-like cupin family protein